MLQQHYLLHFLISTPGCSCLHCSAHTAQPGCPGTTTQQFAASITQPAPPRLCPGSLSPTHILHKHAYALSAGLVRLHLPAPPLPHTHLHTAVQRRQSSRTTL